MLELRIQNQQYKYKCSLSYLPLHFLATKEGWFAKGNQIMLVTGECTFRLCVVCTLLDCVQCTHSFFLFTKLAPTTHRYRSHILLDQVVENCAVSPVFSFRSFEQHNSTVKNFSEHFDAIVSCLQFPVNNRKKEISSDNRSLFDTLTCRKLCSSFSPKW